MRTALASLVQEQRVRILSYKLICGNTYIALRSKLVALITGPTDSASYWTRGRTPAA